MKFLAENPITPHLDTRKDLFEWTVHIHNLVNKSLNKPEVTALEAIQWISLLGTRNRSPLWTEKDEEAISMKSLLLGVGATTLIGGFLVAGYFMFKHYKPLE